MKIYDGVKSFCIAGLLLALCCACGGSGTSTRPGASNTAPFSGEKQPGPPQGSDVIAPPPENPTIKQGTEAPIATLWDISMGMSLAKPNPKSTEWKKVFHPENEYSYQMPIAWKLGIPKQLNQSLCQIIQPVDNKEVKIIFVPWGIYDQKLYDEIVKMETSWIVPEKTLQSASLVNEKLDAINGQDVVQRTFDIILAREPELWTVKSTYMELKPKCYAVVLVAPQKDMAKYNPIYDKIVASFKPIGGKAKGGGNGIGAGKALIPAVGEFSGNKGGAKKDDKDAPKPQSEAPEAKATQDPNMPITLPNNAPLPLPSASK